MGKIIDLTGKRFANWLVLEKSDKHHHHSIHWMCLCDCGEIGYIRNDAIYKATKCCHKKYIDIQGKRFGKLVAIERNGISPDRAVKWKCKCDCGNEVTVIGYNLRHGDSKSCGCSKSEYNSIALTIPNNGSYLNKMYFRYKYDATVKNNREFVLTKEQFYFTIQQDCHYCGRKSNPFDVKSENINGIDRIDSKLGYNTNNCVPCCRQCNIAKNDIDYNGFIDWIERVNNHLKRTPVAVPALWQLQ